MPRNAALLTDRIETLARMSVGEARSDHRALHLEKCERDSNPERFIHFVFE